MFFLIQWHESFKKFVLCWQNNVCVSHSHNLWGHDILCLNVFYASGLFMYVCGVCLLAVCKYVMLPHIFNFITYKIFWLVHASGLRMNVPSIISYVHFFYEVCMKYVQMYLWDSILWFVIWLNPVRLFSDGINASTMAVIALSHVQLMSDKKSNLNH